jgi:hypothetical protein
VDQKLLDLLNHASGNKEEFEQDIRIGNGRAGEIEFDTQTGPVKYTLQPLAVLYGEGRGFPAADPLNEEYQSLFYTIERSILTYYESDENLTDGVVCLTLDRMGVNPACDPRNDELCRCVQFDLRLFLSIENYSKQEVRQALRTISKSVQRHSSTGGVTGYLEFIDDQLGE